MFRNSATSSKATLVGRHDASVVKNQERTDQETLDLLLQLAGRGAVVVVSAVMLLAAKDPNSSFVSDTMLLVEVAAYNLVAAIYARNRPRTGGERTASLIVGDIIEASLVVAISGGYDSLFFAVFLFTMAEIALYLGWRSASILIVGMNGLQILVMGIRIAAANDWVARSSIASRFSRLLIVGFLFVLFAEILRKEEEARDMATRASKRIERLNSIFSQLAQAHLEIEKVLNTVLEAAATLDGVVFSSILEKPAGAGHWKVIASSSEEACPISASLTLPATLDRPAFFVVPVISGGITASGDWSALSCSKRARQLLVCNLTSPGSTTNGLLIVGRSLDAVIGEEDENFLRALAMQTQLALHNALLFEKRTKEIERLNAFKEIQNTFFASAAHEFKTPLTVLGLLASGLEMSIEDPDARQKEMLGTMNQNIARLQSLSANILATARLEANDVVIKARATDLRRLLASIFDELKTILGQKGIDVVFEPDGPWPKVLADPARIRDVLFNLVANAAKFSIDSGCITSSFRIEAEEAWIEICDEGKQIGEAELDSIFDKYYTGKDAGALAGTGLGLYIAKRLVELHGGTIRARSGDRRTCVQFSLPVATAENEDE